MKQALPTFWERPVLQAAAALLAAGLALAAVSPALRPVPNPDSGALLNAGAWILKGKLPYLDFFEFRPPLIIYLNALGLALGGGSRWGVWALEWVSLAAAVLFCYRFLRKYFHLPAAALASLGMAFSLAYFFQGGGLAEEFALPFQFLILLLLSQITQGRPALWPGLGIGLALGMVSSLWLPLAGFGAAVVIYLRYRAAAARDPRKLFPLAWMALGLALVWAGWAGVLTASGNLAGFWEQGIQYYFLWISPLTLDKITAVWNQSTDLFRYSGLVVVAGVAWAAALPRLLIDHERFRRLAVGRFAGVLGLLLGAVLLYSGLVNDQGRLYPVSALSLYRVAQIILGLLALAAGVLVLTGRAARALLPRLRALSDAPALSPAWAMPLALAWIDLPLELGIAVLAWRGFEQHFVFLLPSLTLLAASFLDGLAQAGVFGSRKFAHAFWTFPLGVGLLVSGIWGSSYLILNPLQKESDALKQAADAQAYLQSAEGAGRSFLQWGMETRLYYLLGQSPPTRYAFLAPIFLKSPHGQAYLDEFFAGLRASPPDLILDARTEDQPLIVPADGQCSQLGSADFIHDWLLRDQKSRYRYTEKPLPTVPDKMIAVYRWVCENYRLTATIGKFEWPVYRLRQP